ncbi:hypothetical protein CEXT_803101 [Caerostris extrusa]|uniref:Uncharacterized protein n=1 Tax=Caerostris extrusa TaxID=172846 RepID=A0AAV4VGT1_CAEEX|nr:hypothetical protein CEXT_803101 [Caerostris extrusa]
MKSVAILMGYILLRHKTEPRAQNKTKRKGAKKPMWGRPKKIPHTIDIAKRKTGVRIPSVEFCIASLKYRKKKTHLHSTVNEAVQRKEKVSAISFSQCEPFSLSKVIAGRWSHQCYWTILRVIPF